MEERKFAEKATVDLDLTQKAFKPIPKKIVIDLLLEAIDLICMQFNLQNSKDNNSASVFGFTTYLKNNNKNIDQDSLRTMLNIESLKMSKILSSHILDNISERIEKETGESSSLYDKSCLLFTSEMSKTGILQIQWS